MKKQKKSRKIKKTPEKLYELYMMQKRCMERTLLTEADMKNKM